MSDSENRLSQSWLEAASDLGIYVIAPFTLQTDSDYTYQFIAHIKDFGETAGTLICTPNQFDEYCDVAEEYGYYCSGLYPESYVEYEREHFIKTLNDWGWFGSESNKPLWYTGESWS